MRNAYAESWAVDGEVSGTSQILELQTRKSVTQEIPFSSCSSPAGASRAATTCSAPTEARRGEVRYCSDYEVHPALSSL